MTDRLTINDCRKAGYCVAGAKRRCDELGLSFRALVGEGLVISEIEGIEDHNLQRSLEKARERIAAKE